MSQPRDSHGGPGGYRPDDEYADIEAYEHEPTSGHAGTRTGGYADPPAGRYVDEPADAAPGGRTGGYGTERGERADVRGTAGRVDARSDEYAGPAEPRVAGYIDKPVGRYVDKSASRHPDEPVDRYTGEPASRYTRDRADRYADQPAGGHPDEPDDRYADERADRYAGQPPDRYADGRAGVEWPTEDPEPDPEAPTPPHGLPPAVPGAQGPREPGGREGDRVWVHLVWEAVLLAGVVGAAVTLSALGTSVFSGRPLDFLFLQVAGIGLIASGLAFSLRAAVPNLAVGAVAAVAAALLGRTLEEDVSFPLAALVILTGAVVVGLLLAVVIVGLHVPAWAGSLGAALLVVALATATDGRVGRPVQEAGLITDVPWLWFGVFALVSVGGGVVCAAPGMRRWLGGGRGDRDPARRPGGGAASAAALALTLSTVLAAAGGLVLSAGLGFAEPPNPLGFTLYALAAVLIGGVSAFGRRAGVFGTVLGVTLLLLVLRIAAHSGANLQDAVLGTAVVVGLVVNRLLEAIGRRTA